MLSAFRFRLYPSEEQETALKEQLETCKELHNGAIHERIEHYLTTGKGLSYVDQANALTKRRKENPEPARVHSQALQNVLKRVDTSFENFFEGRTRYPHFKKFVSSMTYPQASQKWIGKNSVYLSRIGRIRMVKHRAVKGKVKTVTVKEYPNGEWYAIIVAETKDIITKATLEIKNPVGIDSGLIDFIYLSDGVHVENPKFIGSHERRIRRAQRKLSSKDRGSANRRKARMTLADRWQDYNNVKDDWQWKLANGLVSRYDFIAYEDLSVSNMVRNHNLARAIQDASWSGFWEKVEWKARQRGILTRAVDPEYTTQECPLCHVRHRAALPVRTFLCPSCGYIAQRDFKAGIVILQRAMREVGMDMSEFTPAEIPTAGHQTDVSHVSSKQETSSPLADEPARGIAFREAHRL